MPMTLSKIVSQLLAGELVAWVKAGAFEGGHIQLSTPASRRVFRFLLAHRGDVLRDTNEALFPGLEKAWSEESDDPAEAETLTAPANVLHSWRLSLIETRGFGGLNSHGGPNFRLEVGRKNWCLEGHNGSGKTSLVSAVIWAMHGLRLRDQDGLVPETGWREPVVDKEGKKIGTWPSICSYPEHIAQLPEVALTWVRLTFTNEEGEAAVAYRQLMAPAVGDPQLTEAIDPRLLTSPELIETNLLMPARLSRIGFGTKSETLYDAVKILTGLDIFNLNLDILEKYMKKLRSNDVPPFNRPPFEKLLNSLGGGGGKALQLLNDSHHQFDGTIGIAQATLVKQFWNKPLEKEIHDAFKVFAQYESYGGEPRIFPWMDNVIEFPPSNSQQVKQLAFVETGIAAAAKTDGRAGDGLILLTDHSLTSNIKLHNHEIYQLAAQTLEPVVNVGDLVIASNYGKVTERNLVVATFEDRLLARRYNLSDLHPNICILTGQSLFPDSTPQPVIAPDDRLCPKRIIGTLFTGALFSPPPIDQEHEIAAVTDLSPIATFLKDAKLYKVSGRSAEPLALDGQYLIARDVTLTHNTLIAHDGKLVIAIDAAGARYFKRMHVREDIVILESLNSDAHTQPEILSVAEDGKFPQLSNLLSVLGVLFELP